MKDFGILCLTFLALCFPYPGFCKIVAYSPSIPGQPLIFHKNEGPNCTIEKKIHDKLGLKNTRKVAHLSQVATRMSEDLIGLIDSLFLLIDPSSKEKIAAIYNEEIKFFISEITHTFSSVKGPPSKKFAKLMNQTLSSFVQISNEMLIDTIGVSTNALFQQDYLKMQEQVINHFNSELANLLKESRHSSLRADVESALQGLVSGTALYISNLNSLTNGRSVGPKSLVLSRQQIEQKLTLFVEASFVLEVLSNH